MTDFATPTILVVMAEHTAAQRNCDQVRTQPLRMREMKVGVKPGPATTTASPIWAGSPSTSDTVRKIGSVL